MPTRDGEVQGQVLVCVCLVPVSCASVLCQCLVPVSCASVLCQCLVPVSCASVLVCDYLVHLSLLIRKIAVKVTTHLSHGHMTSPNIDGSHDLT